jgi:pimeloyl-ACP methyl ester carboxylesterase
MKYPARYRALHRSVVCPSSTERPGRKTPRRFFCCTDFRPRRVCSSRSSPVSPIAVSASRPIIPAADIATGPTRNSSHIPSITFDQYAEIMNFTEALGLSRYTLYMQDYGGPVGFRMASAHPDRIDALMVQDAWRTTKAWERIGRLGGRFGPIAPPTKARCVQICCPSLRTARAHVGSDPNVESCDPDLWTDEFYFLNQPGQAEIQSDLFYDYRTNVDGYPKWQAWMREKQPRLLVIWRKYDLSFDLGEPERHRKDVPNAQVHIHDAGHFALDTAADEIAMLVGDFVDFQIGDLQARRAS